MHDTIPPKIIVHCHKPGEMLACVDRLKSLERELKSLPVDYLSPTRHVSSVACESPVQWGHLFTFFMQRSEIPSLPLFAGHPLGSTKLGPQGFQNCLTLPGLLCCKRISGNVDPPIPGTPSNTIGMF